jgi:hypothetical protein
MVRSGPLAGGPLVNQLTQPHIHSYRLTHIDKFDFLDDYQRARLEAFQKPLTIQNSFAASGLVQLTQIECFQSLISLCERLHH